MPKPSPFRLLLRLAARYPWRVTIGLFMATLGTLLGFVLPNTTRWIIDEVIPKHDMARLWQLTLLTLGAMLLRQVLYSLRTLANRMLPHFPQYSSPLSRWNLPLCGPIPVLFPALIFCIL